MLNRLLAPLIRLPYFRGKSRIDTFLMRKIWVPEVSEVLHGLKMELDPYEGTQFKLLRRDWIEPKTLKLYGRLLVKGDVFVDVGAHVGFHSLVARSWIGETGRVIALEPQPYNAGKIMANWTANGFTNLELHVAAAGDKPGVIQLHEQNRFERSCLSVHGTAGDLPLVFSVSLVRLEDVLEKARVNRVKLLKLDVESYETEVLIGLGAKLQSIDNLVFEVLNETKEQLNSGERALVLMRNAGYQLRTVEGEPYQSGMPLPERNVWATRESHQ